MAKPPTKLQRWLDVISFLAGRRFPVATEELWANVPAYAPGTEEGDATAKRSVRRMFERDKDDLRGLGIPIETVEFSVNYGRERQVGYRLARKDFQLPYLRLLRSTHEGGRLSPRDFEISPDEAGAALDGLQELARIPSFPLAREARSAFRKLAFDLEPEVAADVPVFYAEDPETAATGPALTTLSDAVERRKRLAFRYRVMSRGTEEDRRANPYGLLFQHGRWYLVAHDLDRDAERMYRVGRMDDIVPNAKDPGTPDFEVPPEFSLEAYAGRKAWELGGGEGEEESITAQVRFRFPRSLWAERNGHGELVEQADDGGQVRAFRVRRTDPFVRWVLSLAGDARLEEPEELRQAFEAMAGRVARMHRDA